MENAAGYTSMGGYTRSRPLSSDGTTIQLILADDSRGHKRHRLDIGSSTTLKVLFNNQAKKRGVFLRSLRFSYCSKTLFLGAVGNRTPQEMYTKDQAVTYVYPNCSSRMDSGNSEQNQELNSKKCPYFIKMHVVHRYWIWGDMKTVERHQS
jgi:hypothetical protein